MVTKSIQIAACTLLVCVVGCGEKGPPTVPAKGVVTLDGQPVENAAIVIVSTSSADQAVGTSDASGNFSLDAFDYKTGALPGEYYVIATKSVEIEQSAGELQGEEAEHAAEDGGAMQLGVQNVLPKKYAQPSGELTLTVPAEGVTDIKLELSSN
jgi:hypothetical protein